MYRRAFDRPSASAKSRPVKRTGPTAIPRNDGRAGFLEAVILLSTMVALAIALGLTVGLPLMLMLSDVCIQLQC